MKIFLAGFLILLAACDQTPGICDYCGKDRTDIKRYACLTCEKSHACCDAEKYLLKSQDGVDRKGFHYNANTCISVCPTAQDKFEPEVRTVFVQRSRQTEIFYDCLIGLIIGAAFYCKGRVDMKNKLYKGKSSS